MNISEIVTQINTRHGTHFTLHSRYATGENQGAYALTDEHQNAYVLKFNLRPTWLRSVRRAQRITDYLREHHVSVPQYILMDSFDNNVTYWIQTALPGTPPQRILSSHLRQLLALIDVQAGRALSNESNWSEYVRTVIFQGESGWRDSLQHYSAATRTVLNRLTRLVAGMQATLLRNDDIVHGDLGPDNVLVVGDDVRGIVDWDAAGNGDRSLDFSKLLFYTYEDAAIRESLRAKIVAVSGRDAYTLYLSYNILAQLDWSIHHHSADAVDGGVAMAHQILHDVEAQ